MKQLPVILNQGNNGSCQSYAIAQFLNTKLNKGIDPEKLYHEMIEYNYGRDTFSTVDVFEHLKTTEKIIGYDHQWVGRLNTTRIENDKLVSFYTPQHSTRIAKNVCNSGGGVISILAPVKQEYMKSDGELTQACFSKDNRNNNHAVYLYDYDDEKKRFILVNSWGTGYGDGSGCLYLPYEMINMALDLITV